MIIDKLKQNEEVSPSDYEIKLLKSALPDYFDAKDGGFDLERLKELLKKKEVSVNKEAYELDFLGKSYARLESSTATTTVVTPDKTHNEKLENKDSENVYIVGDNLDALKHLLGSYSRKIKCIYIDPPYNTGSDEFVYPDNFQLNAQDMAEQLGMTEDEAQRTIDMAGKSTHSAWLTFMYPRLMLARSLLTDDGVIFISIDDNEQANLKLLCDSIYGEENFISQLVWQNKKGGGNDSTHLAVEHEYITMIAKKKEVLPALFEDYDVAYLKRYNEEDSIGKFYWDTFKRKSGKQYYPISTPDGSVLQFDESGNEISWLRSEKRFYRDLKEGEVKVENRTGNWNVYFKQRLPRGKKPRSIYDDESILTDAGTTSMGSSEVLELFGKNIFDNPKPSMLISHLVSIIVEDNDYVLDFFSGSATTAHAVMQLNAKNIGDLRYILVQLPEKTDPKKEAFKAGYQTIDQIGRARIEKAAQKIKDETGADIDYGYKAYILNEIPNKTLDQLEEFSTEELNFFSGEDSTSLFAFDDASGVETMLATWLLEDGYGLGTKPVILQLENYPAYHVGNSLYLLENGLSTGGIQKLITLLETGELTISRIVSYPYSFNFEITKTLRENLSSLKNTRVNLIERY